VSEGLTGERWRRLEELFEAAVELPEEQQEALIGQTAAEDPALGRELAGMLAHSSGMEERLGKLVESSAAAAAPAGIWIGRRFGPYRVVSEIGRGGMGLVFEAVRDDDEYRMTVALKVAPWWRDVDLLRERFRHERQILAGLEHPNIARFLDGGTEVDIPYFAMEYVKGSPITEYCRKLGLRERIDLFLEVCAAVRYAHENLIVHRDLKPANILVPRDGGPVRLADFGVARIAGEATATATGSVIGTMNYLAPEVLNGRLPGPACDIYALGITLYELLTGAPPFTADHPGAIVKRHLEDAPAPHPAIPIELWPLLTSCLAKDPAARPTAQALATNLQSTTPTRPGPPPNPFTPHPPTPAPTHPPQEPPTPLPPPEEPPPAFNFAPPPQTYGRLEGSAAADTVGYVGSPGGRRGAWLLGVGAAVGVLVVVAGVGTAVALTGGGGHPAAAATTSAGATAPAAARSSGGRKSPGTMAGRVAASATASPSAGAGKKSPAASSSPTHTVGRKCARPSTQPSGNPGKTMRACISTDGVSLHLEGWMSPVPNAAANEQVLLNVRNNGSWHRTYTSPVCGGGTCYYSLTVKVPAGSYHVQADCIWHGINEFQGAWTPFVIR